MPADLGQALAAIGLFRAAPGGADLAGELRRLGSTELLRLEMADWLLGAASMQVLMAAGAADDAGVDPVAINWASARAAGMPYLRPLRAESDSCPGATLPLAVALGVLGHDAGARALRGCERGAIAGKSRAVPAQSAAEEIARAPAIAN